MSEEEIQEPAAPVAAQTKPFTIAVIDDALIPLSLSRLTVKEEADAVVAALRGVDAEAELTSRGFDPGRVEAEPDAAFEALSSPAIPLGEGWVAVAGASEVAGRMINERHSIKNVIALIEVETGGEVLQCSPLDPLPDLTGRDLVLIDYYLEGSSGTGDLATELARQVRAQGAAAGSQQIVLMSSVEKVRDLRQRFRSDTGVEGASFAFIAKDDIDEPWNVRAHLEMLARARNYGPAMAGYREQLEQSIQAATSDLLMTFDDLDLGDFGYIQSQALNADGHPLGDYLGFLLSSHLTSLAFEHKLRESQATLDVMEFEAKPFAPTEPSPVIATLFHSALFSRNLGPLGPHPRSAKDGKYSGIPLVQLGDVFLHPDNSQAIVVLSADCDLAFSPNELREPDPETPVILVPGDATSLRVNVAAEGPATEGISKGAEVYRIGWEFKKYRAVNLSELPAYLEKRGFDLSNRDRLRPLYGLKLQQEFGAHLLRVGPPVMPPMTWGEPGKLFLCLNGCEEVLACDSGDVMLSKFKDKTTVRLTPKLVGAIRRQSQALLVRMELELEERKAAKKSTEGNFKKIEAVAKELGNDDFWAGLLGDRELNPPGSLLRQGAAFALVRGAKWDLPNKPTIVMQVGGEDDPAPAEVEELDP